MNGNHPMSGDQTLFRIKPVQIADFLSPLNLDFVKDLSVPQVRLKLLDPS